MLRISLVKFLLLSLYKLEAKIYCDHLKYFFQHLLCGMSILNFSAYCVQLTLKGPKKRGGGSWNQTPGLYGIKIILVLKFVKDAADLIKSLEEIKFLIFTYFILSCNIIMNHSITED